MRAKRKLRFTDMNYDVYIDEDNVQIEQRIQQELQMLLNTIQGSQPKEPEPSYSDMILRHPQKYARNQQPQLSQTAYQPSINTNDNASENINQNSDDKNTGTVIMMGRAMNLNILHGTGMV